MYVFLKNEARKLNHKEVVEEDRKSKLPTNFEAKRKRIEWEEEQEKKRKVNLYKTSVLKLETLSQAKSLPSQNGMFSVPLQNNE